MSNLQNKTLPINCTGANINNEECLAMEEGIIKQFRIIVAVVFVVLLFFLGFFVYNLIKCYLPKWRRERELKEEVERKVEIRNSSNEKQDIELNN